MRYYLEDYCKYAEITAYKGVSFKTAEAYLKTHRKESRVVDIQFFDAEIIATTEHLYFATVNALQAFKEKTNASKNVAVEILLYVSAQRQIQKAINLCGIKQETNNMAVVMVGENINQIESALDDITDCVGKWPDESALVISKKKEKKIMATYGIKNKELATVIIGGQRLKAIVDLVIERMALLATQF
jgi:tRNA threonylcarbamoyladenosine modification (KEOPS) complex Cgi121 subunit